MIVNDTTRRVMANRKESRDMIEDGWERVSEGGGRLWELHRGWRSQHKITDVKISNCGKFIWVKITDPQAHEQ